MNIPKRLLEFEIGRYFGPTLFQFLLVMAIFLKLHFGYLRWRWYVLIYGSSLFAVWLLGYVMLRTGFYGKYQSHIPIFKNIVNKIDKKNVKE